MQKYFARTTREVTELEKAHMKTARALAGECVVLLKNEGVLPLLEKGNLAIFGNGARETIKGGTGSGDVNSRYFVNVEEGLKNAGFTITSTDWLDEFSTIKNGDKERWQKWIHAEAAKRKVPPFTLEFSYPLKESRVQKITQLDLGKADTDTAIYVLARNSGEGADRFNEKGDYQFYDEELEAIRFLAKEFKKFILVLNIGGMMELTPLSEISGIGAIVLMGQLGNIGGDVIADVLTGRVNPSGKLVDTFAKDYYDYPSSKGFSHNNGDTDDEYYTEGIYVGYRYFDSFGVEPLYPFGYGLSYSSFKTLVKSTSLMDQNILVEAEVTNTGHTYAGKEVVQVYAQAPVSEIKKAHQVLVGYAKTEEIAPRQTTTLSIEIPIRNLASYSKKLAAWVLDAGEYQLRVGNSSRDTSIVARIHVTEQVILQQCMNLFEKDVEFGEITAPKRTIDDVNPAVDRLVIGAKDIQKVDTIYTKEHPLCKASSTTAPLTLEDVLKEKASLEELVSQLSVEEMADLCVGIFRTKEETGEEANVIGNAAQAVPGAAGETSSKLIESRKIPNLILADGPAGLRLTPEFEADGVNYYQYCTAIPIAWSLAMSWNEQMVEEVGQMIGEEMDEFHVDLWLAPALNIHRNPLCGRNFEYYSEDPLISGKVAAAITRGVQKHAGRGTTIKHFAANNLEDNRFFNNSHMDEQVVREIYLRGFEIAVRESQPRSIMTSYNLINGIHTPNRKDLLQYVARDEWGFKGFFMTDWLTSVNIPEISMANNPKYPISSSVGCIYAGNDVQMPGCLKNITDIVDAVENNKEVDGFKITRGDLEFTVCNLLRFFLPLEQ